MRCPLLAVLALTVVTSTSAADPLVPPDQPMRLSVEVDADGAGTLRFGPVKDAELKDVEWPEGEAVALRSFPSATATRTDDGTVTLTQPVTSAADLKAVLTFDDRNRITALDQAVTIRSAKLPQFSNAKQAVGGVVMMRGRLPLRMAVDLSRCELPAAAIQLETISASERESVTASVSRPKREVKVIAIRRPPKQRPQVTQLARQPLRDTVDLAFDLPEPMRDAPITLQFNAVAFDVMSPPPEVVIDSVSIGGSLAPMFGAALKPFAGQVGVDRVVPGSIAEAAGLRTGDFITSIDGVDVSTVPEAIAEFSRQTIGSTYEVGILRGGDAATMTVSVE